MFDFMFGWRKASKCKKLIKKVQCRLNLLKNKRSCIVRQLRNDVAQLIKHGHYQTAFNRVDQIYKDECIIEVYDLLAHFSEFISLQFSYIRRNKDCPNDINEAISSLIFASARCGDLPELLHIRKLFSERYGQRFEATALDLLPGNLVNFQIRENLSIKNVPNEVKYKLVGEITTSALQTGPLALEFASEKHQEATKSIALQAAPATGTEQTVTVDFSPIRFDFGHPAGDTYPTGAESSSENSTTNIPKEVVYLDDVEELQPPFNDGENGKDQRVFVFKSSVIVPVEKTHKTDESNDFEIEHSKVKRRTRKRSISSDIECSSYYDNSRSHRRKASDKNRKRSGNSCTPGHQNHLFAKRIGDLGKCSRAMTMPCNRSTKCVGEDGVNVMRWNSFPVQACSPHVHPKLPDYDELAAKFMALKQENLQKQK